MQRLWHLVQQPQRYPAEARPLREMRDAWGDLVIFALRRAQSFSREITCHPHLYGCEAVSFRCLKGSQSSSGPACFLLSRSQLLYSFSSQAPSGGQRLSLLESL